MKIEIIPSNKNSEDLMNTLFSESSPKIGAKKELSEDYSITYIGSIKEKGLSPNDFKEIVEITLTISSNIALGVVSNYLYDKLKNRARKIWINDIEIDSSNLDEYEKIIREQFEENR